MDNTLSITETTGRNGAAVDLTGRLTMRHSTLSHFRNLAEILAGDEPRDWEWIGEHLSQRMFRITEARAKAYAEDHGGIARKMEPIL